ncbi:MAG: TonB-dependent receptor [Candidatus Pedobacter colombiensis]|uniref:TonB-dependent receptor n=1 Tax=Candidatus Pedobacter colombiensis TaxID=3121371 RepID=A0AAJ5W5K6_9SPHI|nr:TonB-dependent receptor [Pedobacter sp.]WEK17533.1 MAG: TonB-dependent receptor [Pedobacter sp.]
MSPYRYFILSIGLVFCFLHSQAQTQPIKGHIYDSQTRAPLADVIILNGSKQQLAKSDANGYFVINDYQSQELVQAVLVGYKEQNIKLNPDDRDLNVQLDADGVSLNEVRVAGYNSNKTSKETAGAIAVITAKDINRGSAVSLQSALNAIPGVRMEQSTLSEARISIRGNGVRSAYGIRNIKIYVNEIPVTEADGTTRIEALDVNSIGRAEVIKGPASSIYGAGTGGVINFQLQRSPYQEQSLEASGLIGANGLHRLATTYRSGGDKVNSYVSYGWQEYDGYREHSNDMRRFLTGNFQLFPSDKRIITLLVNRTTQHSQIPGSLTADQVAANPLQANATNLDKEAGRYQTWTRIGLGQQYRFNDQFSNTTSVFTYFYDLNHPLPYAYIRNFYQSYGGRTRFSYDPGFSTFPTRFTVGAEFNEGLTKGTQYVNNQGKEGAINGNVDYQNTQYSVFYQSETALTPKTTLTLGLSYNSLRYDVNDYLKQNQSGLKKFNPQATPRIALSHTFSPELSLHASVSTGFSPPSSSEIKNVDGSINPTLQAEKGINYELNAKGNLLKSRLEYDLAIFKMDMKGELIAQSIQQGITIYNNAGKTSHNGAELSLSYQILKPEDQNEVLSLRPFVAVTYSDFKFKDYKTLNAQNEVTAIYNGNKLTGIAPWVFNAGVDMETKVGLYFYGSYYYSDRLPLNDANSAYNPSYEVVNAKLGYKKQIFKCLETNLYAGLDNILNKSYSSIVSLNAVGFGGAQPAYFNPSPKRNGYAGLNVKYIF